MNIRNLIFLLSLAMLGSCKKEADPIVVTAEALHMANNQITAVMVHDIFSPPVASRIYSYSNIAAYEVMAQFSDEYETLGGQLTDFEPVPAPTSDKIHPEVASLVAFYEIGRSLLFSEEKLTVKRDSLYNIWKSKDEETFLASEAYGMQVADHIRTWMNKDNYAATRTMPKFSIFTEDQSRWQPTPPTYMDGIEPHWSKIRPFVIKADQFKPVPPPAFSLEPGTAFYTELMEVYEIGNKIKEEGDDSEMLNKAKFWDCNPYVSVLKGHLMFATKKITPGGHWIGIAQIASKTSGADFSKSAYAYTKTAITIADGFISCWDEKYRSNLVRPETLINKYIDDSWTSILQTPPFPEYTSGHSVVSGAAAVALTDIFGPDFAFEDDTEVEYGLPMRKFNSFLEASEEAAQSRLYGGIHYRSAIEIGLDQGQNLGNYVVSKLQMKKRPGQVASK